MTTIYVLIKVGDIQDAAKKLTVETGLKAAFESGFTSAWRPVGHGTYLVAVKEPTLTRNVSDKLGVSDGKAGSYIVTKLDPYYGWADKEVWEWISTYGGSNDS